MTLSQTARPQIGRSSPSSAEPGVWAGRPCMPARRPPSQGASLRHKVLALGSQTTLRGKASPANRCCECRRCCRQGKSVNYAESPISGKEASEEEEEKGSEVSEAEKLQQQAESRDGSGSSSEGSGSSGGEEEEEDSPPRQRGRRPAARRGNGSGRGHARSPDGTAARPRRGAAAGPKKYNDNDSDDGTFWVFLPLV